MPSTSYTMAQLKILLADLRKDVLASGHKTAKVQWWGIMVHENGARLSATFIVPNQLGGDHSSVTTRTMVL